MAFKFKYKRPQLYFSIKYNFILIKSKKQTKGDCINRESKLQLNLHTGFLRIQTFKRRSRAERKLTLCRASPWRFLRSLKTTSKSRSCADSASCNISKTFCTSGSFVCSVRALNASFLSRQQSSSASGPLPYK